jgi:FPC/CPF motif-containing protein YcgG
LDNIKGAFCFVVYLQAIVPVHHTSSRVEKLKAFLGIQLKLKALSK